MHAKRINYMRQREFANYLRSDPQSVDVSQQNPQMTLSHQKPKDLNEAFEATFGGEKHAWHGSDEQEKNESDRLVQLSSANAKQSAQNSDV